MEANAKLSFVRITPRKLGLLAAEVRGKNINEALSLLKFSPRKRTAQTLYTLLKSAAANADNKAKGAVDIDTLYVKKITVTPGPILKRFRPRAKGSAYRINKKQSHVFVTLAER
ncbi:MAG: 50S ribosomal protein L22 [Deltaproteobacteria bacterium]|nr:50S ribosomal protein L22 [Deltaproteobacteria bacterium]